MTDTVAAPVDDADLLAEVSAWLDEHWDPDLTVAQWWDLVGTGQVLFGSDWPHGEALANPLDFVKELHAFSDDETRMVMRDNALGLLAPSA